MSKHETELRRRLAGDKVDIYQTISWFLAAVDAKAHLDGKPGELDFSDFEYDFLLANRESYREEHLRRMSNAELVNLMATCKPDPNSPRIDMSGMPDQELVEASLWGPYADSATAEMVKRANAKCMTVVDFIRDVK